MARRSRESSFLPVMFVLSSVLLGLYVTSPVYGGGRNIVMPSRFGSDDPMVATLRGVLEEIEQASRAGNDQALERLISPIYAAELREAISRYQLDASGSQSLRGIGVGPRQLKSLRLGATQGDVVVIVQDYGPSQHRLWRFVWTGFYFVLDRVEFVSRMSSRAELSTLVGKRLRSRMD